MLSHLDVGICININRSARRLLTPALRNVGVPDKPGFLHQSARSQLKVGVIYINFGEFSDDTTSLIFLLLGYDMPSQLMC